MRLREITVGDVPVRALRVTFVGELRLGALLPDRVRRRPVADAVGGRRAARPARRGLPRDRLAAPREGLPRVGGRHHARRDPARGGARVLRAPATRTSSGARRSTRRRGPGCAADLLDDPRAVALGNEPVRVGGAIVGRVTSGGYGYTVARSIAYAYLPADVEPRYARGGRRVRDLGPGHGDPRAAVRPALRARAAPARRVG